jgi:plasmid stabilization system protein ParE
MTGLSVFFTALAEEDLDQIEDYISAHDPAAAARVRATIVQQSLQLGNTPSKGPMYRRRGRGRGYGKAEIEKAQIRNTGAKATSMRPRGLYIAN